MPFYIFYSVFKRKPKGDHKYFACRHACVTGVTSLRGSSLSIQMLTKEHSPKGNFSET